MSVRAEAKKLDRAVPGWVNRIDLDSLSLRDGENCVLTQVFSWEQVTRVGDTEFRFKRDGWWSGPRNINRVVISGSNTAYLFNSKLFFWKREIRKRLKRQEKEHKNSAPPIVFPAEWVEEQKEPERVTSSV